MSDQFREFHEECELETLELAMIEDLNEGDITTLAIIPPTHRSKGIFRAKSFGVISGLAVAERLFSLSALPNHFHSFIKDGEEVESGTIIAEVTGPTDTLLVCERTSLNVMQRMSGIATKTREFVRAVSHTKAVILDTRKTSPGMRYFDKAAVRDGGGRNHRFGLYDMILIKDNHVDAAGSVGEAIARAKAYLKKESLEVKIEVEVRSIPELKAALISKPDIILIDNFTIDALKEAVEISREINPKVLLEASGGVSLQTVGKIAETGVDFISVGELTHSVTALDISMKIIPLAS
ncbi:MAG: carboxylating nicotinate-nucleotide diphosphorylase [Chloroherpetonaceae bacterium]|nr:carboxylating nicotinate-nucleotide diphosphorylase [Chloroherpetonaceae bacterium]